MALPGAVRRGWRGLSAGKRTILMLALLVLAWQAMLSSVRLMNKKALSDIQVTLLSGESTNLAALADGKPLVVNLWASWCPPCRHEMPVLAAAQQHETGISFVFANQGEHAASVHDYLSSSRLDLANVALDRDARLGSVAGSMALPITLFYDARGQLVASHRGALTAATLAGRLKQFNPSK